MKRTATLSALLLIAAACALANPSTPQVPDNLKPAADESMLSVVSARGVQIYECRMKSDDATEWAFVAPEAELFVDGKRMGTHYAGPQWESFDAARLPAW